jgi:uncharacterized protein YbaP (TraB family)
MEAVCDSRQFAFFRNQPAQDRCMPLDLRTLALLLGVTTLALPSVAASQDAPPSPSALVEEVQVIARLPGPALWRVSTPNSQLWILGVAGPLPRRFEWDSRRVNTALVGARELILPPAAALSPKDLFGLLLDRSHVLHMPRGQTLRGDLSPPLRARFEAAARAVGQDPGHYDHWRPVVASIAMVFDAENHDQLDKTGSLRAVADLARRNHVPIRRLADYRAADLVKSWAQVPPEATTACVTLAVSMVERLPVDAPLMAKAWARGDLAAVKEIDEATSNEGCFQAAPAVGALQDRVAKDWARDLQRILAQPGKTVVEIDLPGLTRKGGLLDQLRADGLNVIGPAY